MDNPTEDVATGPKTVEFEPESADDLLLTDEARAAKAAATGAAAAPETPAATEEASSQTEEKPPETPAPTKAAEAAVETPPADEGGAWDEETVQGLEKLDTYLESQVAERAAEQRRGLDKTISRLQTEHTAEMKALREEVRQTQINGVPEEEREALRNKWTHDDRMSEVNAREDQVRAYDADVTRFAALTEYREFGVTEADLLDKPVEEIETFCLQKKAEHFEKLAQGAATKATAPPPKQEAAPATADSGTKEEKKAPAGASAPSDVGGTPPAPKAPEFNPGQGRDSMLENLKNLPVETVQRG